MGSNGARPSSRAFPSPSLDRLVGEFQRAVDRVLQDDDTVTSELRTLDENVAVGGEPDSQHLLGLAVDVVPGDGDQAALAVAFESEGLVAVVSEKGHVHAQLLPSGQARALGLFG